MEECGFCGRGLRVGLRPAEVKLHGWPGLGTPPAAALMQARCMKIARKLNPKPAAARKLCIVAVINPRVQRENQDLQLYTNNKNNRGQGKAWEAVPFLHLASFDSLALDPILKAQIVEDLDEFIEGEEFYSQVGKAWKRGYLLYGPPGTGKSSMIAAIANKLRYDVYDLELMEVESNADLRRLLLQTSNKPGAHVRVSLTCPSFPMAAFGPRVRQKPPPSVKVVTVPHRRQGYC